MLLKHSQIILHKVVLIFCIKLEYYKIQVISEMPFGPHLVKKKILAKINKTINETASTQLRMYLKREQLWSKQSNKGLSSGFFLF